MLEIFYVTQSNIVNELSQSSNSFSDILKPYINFKKLGFISFQDFIGCEVLRCKADYCSPFYMLHVLYIFSSNHFLKFIALYLYSIL